jgi:hypothetical protein
MLPTFLYAHAKISGKISNEKNIAHKIPPMTTLAKG